jgi:hypothetical protein
MGEKILRRFLHISDLHIDGVSYRERRFSALMQRLLRFIPGLYGHDPLALDYIEELHSELQTSCAVGLLFTGDLTRLGSLADYEAGENFFDLRAPHDATAVSLQIPGWRACSIAGNHDHWPGHVPYIPAAPTAGLRRCFPFDFWVGRAEQVTPNLNLRLMGIDGDCDSRPKGGLRRVLARGHFAHAIADLGQALGACPRNEARVLLLHHSVRGAVRGMSRASRTQLERFVETHEIRAILTGHLHRFYLGPCRDLPKCFELRCGTSAVVVRKPIAWSLRLPGAPAPASSSWEGQTALVHELVQRGSEVWWRALVYGRSFDGRFQRRSVSENKDAAANTRSTVYEFRLSALAEGV